VHWLTSQIDVSTFIVKLVAVQLVHLGRPCCGQPVNLAAWPIEPPFWTPLQPPSAEQLHVHTRPRHVSAVPSMRSYPSAHAVVWVLLAFVQVGVTPLLEFLTAVHALQILLFLPWQAELA